MLSITGVTKRFGGLTAVSTVDLLVEEGKIIGLIGPNGAGKTTFFNILTGLYKPNEGMIRFLEEDIAGLPPYKIAQCGIARTFQNIRLLSDESVLDNVKLGMFSRTKVGAWGAIFARNAVREEEERVTQESLAILELVGLAGQEEEIAGSLSYGNQRRVEIARALVSKPKLLLLDEPTAGMNGEEVNQMMELVRAIQQMGTTIILIEHNVSLVMNLCDKVAVLDHGKKIADGNPEDIINNPLVIEAYIGKVEEVTNFA